MKKSTYSIEKVELLCSAAGVILINREQKKSFGVQEYILVHREGETPMYVNLNCLAQGGDLVFTMKVVTNCIFCDTQINVYNPEGGNLIEIVEAGRCEDCEEEYLGK